MLDAYEDVFHINANPTDKDRAAIEGKFKSTLNSSDRVAEAQTATFLALLRLADIDAARKRKGLAHKAKEELGDKNDADRGETAGSGDSRIPLNLRYQIEVHLPPTKDIEVYNAIFRSLRENLIG